MSIKTDKNKIEEQLDQLLAVCEVEEDDEIVPNEELEESEAVWQEHLTGNDPGEPLEKVRQDLLGHE